MNSVSMTMAEDQTGESRVQRNEIKPEKGCDDFQHGDKTNRFSMKTKPASPGCRGTRSGRRMAVTASSKWT